MRRKWLKRATWLLLAPIILFTILMALLYVPTVQNFLRRQATTIASEATGMEISVERIDLRFPLNLLIRGILVVQPHNPQHSVHRADTLLNLGSLNVRVQAWPLLKGKVEIDDITLKQVKLNSSHLIEGVRVKGVLGRFFLQAHGIDLTNEDAVFNNVELSDTHVRVMLTDTTATPVDTTQTVVNWKIALHALKLQNVSVAMVMPLDSTYIGAHIAEARIGNATADLKKQRYAWQKFQLTGSSVNYDVGKKVPVEGFDASHIALRDIRIGIDSVLIEDRNMNAVLREFSLNERSGLNITSLTAQLTADSALIRIPYLKLLTPHSEIDFTAQTYWELINIPTSGRLTARFNASIGKQDVLLFAGNLPRTFKDAYPFRPLVIHAGTEGNLTQMQLSRFTAELPGAFSLNGGGELWNLTDSLKRSGTLDFEMKTRNLNFLTGLTGVTPDGSVVVPENMDLIARLDLDGPHYIAKLKIREQEGALNLSAAYNTSTEAYRADLLVDALQLHNFLPKDSIYSLTAKMSVQGKGMSLVSHRSASVLEASLGQLQYGKLDISNVKLNADLKAACVTVNLLSDNPLLKMKADGNMRLDRRYLDGELKVDVEQLDLHKLGIAPKPMSRPFAFNFRAEGRRDSIKIKLDAGDMDLQFRARSTLKKLLEQSQVFAQILTRQIEDRRLDHAELRRVLPSANMRFKAGQQNPVSYFLATKDISFHDFSLRFGFSPTRGINGRTALHGLRMDSLQLDTIFFAIKQDTTRMQLQGGVINGPKNPQVIFRSTLTGEIRSEDAGLMIDYTDGKGETGVLFGVNARPLNGGKGKGNGVLLQFTPEQPIIAFRKFRYMEESNWVYLHKDMRVYANIDMRSDDGMRFRMQSDRADTVSLQNMNVELARFRLSELTNVMPYLPRLTGLFSAEAKYIQTATSLQLSTEANIRELTYEGQPVGDIGVGVTWLPGDADAHYLNTYFTYNNEEVMMADGVLTGKNGKDSIEVTTRLEHLPLKMLNAFIPNQLVSFTGDVDGGVYISGSLDKPQMQGDVSLDSVSVYAKQVGARYWFDNRPVRFENNRLLFDKFAIYTTSRNPFTIDGNVDFRNIERPMANLNLLANNYTLLSAPRTRESMVYGKVFVDLKATVRGPVDALVMRGSMNLLGNTDVTYVLTDSPLTVEDRLDGLVTFTSFTDTTTVSSEETPTMSLGGMDMVMAVRIDNAVRLRADLSPDRSKFVELEGGGDLNLQYTPQGDMNLSGRYTLSGGVMKYSLPIIPLKEFEFNNGSYVDWRGNPMNPTLNLKATERVRASVADGDNGGSRMVNFDVSISIKNKLEAPELVFDISAPDDATVENELLAMGSEERSKQAIAMLATGVYLKGGAKGGGLDMGAALNSVLQSQINSLAGSALQSVNANFSLGVEDRTTAETGDKQTDYSFRYSQRFFNDRIQIVIGGKVSTGSNATNDVESFIDNISVEYRLDNSGARYVRVFHDKNYESVLDGEITETGLGIVLRRKMDHLGELFLFKRNKKPEEKSDK